MVAIIGYAVASRAMYNFNSDPDTDDLTFDGRSIFRHLLYPVYYFMYGSFDNELSALDRTNFLFPIQSVFYFRFCRKSGFINCTCYSSFISILYVIREYSSY